MAWPVRKEHSDHMRLRRNQNRVNSVTNENEQWMKALLASRTKLKWTPQVSWGFRIFDFWSHECGIAVEVDGPEHRAADDMQKDLAAWNVSGIIVLRVRNQSQSDAKVALEMIERVAKWGDHRKRREFIGITKAKYSRARMTFEQYLTAAFGK